MRKEIEINGCIEIPPDMTANEFEHTFIEWIESNGWYFGGGLNEIVDGHYVNADGTTGNHVLDD